MRRSLQIKLNHVAPTPHSLRANAATDAPAQQTEVNLGQLFQHYYFDSFPTAPPKPDPSNFEYLELVSGSPEFRFVPFIKEASVVKKRAISTELGQAFCRWMLSEHFGIHYFAHMADVLDKPTHAVFGGLRIERFVAGDVPDYLCARSVTSPRIAEAKGRFSSIGFDTVEFERWREQFTRIRVKDGGGQALRLKGYVVGTRFSIESPFTPTRIRSAIFVEDPETPGEREARDQQDPFFGRVVLAMHYARVFRKIGVVPVASALGNGFSLANELRFQLPVWTCFVEPLLGREFVGGYYQTNPGRLPTLTKEGWQFPLELGQGHACFVGLELSVARQVAAAARGDWAALDTVETMNGTGRWSSEFSWLRDGTVVAPLQNFLPTGIEQL